MFDGDTAWTVNEEKVHAAKTAARTDKNTSLFIPRFIFSLLPKQTLLPQISNAFTGISRISGNRPLIDHVMHYDILPENSTGLLTGEFRIQQFAADQSEKRSA